MSGSNTDREREKQRQALIQSADSYLRDEAKHRERIGYGPPESWSLAGLIERMRDYLAGQSTASQPTLADDALAKVLAYCYAPEGIDIEGYAFAFLDPDKVRRIIRGQEAVDAKPSEPNRG